MVNPETTATVLVADDQPAIVDALVLLLEGAGFAVHSATSRRELMARLGERPFDAILMDLNYARDTTSGGEGLEIIAELHARDRLLPIIAMTGWSTVGTAVEAMRRGARTFVPKPWDNAALVETLRREIDEARVLREDAESASREIVDAKRVQRALLPRSLPELTSCRMAAVWEPASAFGGDCYDAFPLTASTAAVLIADVCGKGLAAALLMSNLQASVRALAEPDRTPSQVVTRVNSLLCRHQGLNRFVTVFYATLDTCTRQLRYTNAGHPPPLLLKTGGSVERLGSGGPVVGVFEHAAYDEGLAWLGPGDRLLMYTDGITEACGQEQVEFGDDRLLEIVRHRDADDPDAMLAGVMDAVRLYAAGPLQDDATLLAVAITA